MHQAEEAYQVRKLTHQYILTVSIVRSRISETYLALWDNCLSYIWWCYVGLPHHGWQGVELAGQGMDTQAREGAMQASRTNSTGKEMIPIKFHAIMTTIHIFVQFCASFFALTAIIYIRINVIIGNTRIDPRPGGWQLIAGSANNGLWWDRSVSIGLGRVVTHQVADRQKLKFCRSSFLTESLCILIKISWTFVPKGVGSGVCLTQNRNRWQYLNQLWPS